MSRMNPEGKARSDFEHGKLRRFTSGTMIAVSDCPQCLLSFHREYSACPKCGAPAVHLYSTGSVVWPKDLAFAQEYNNEMERLIQQTLNPDLAWNRLRLPPMNDRAERRCLCCGLQSRSGEPHARDPQPGISVVASPASGATLTNSTSMRILFVCTANAIRSAMAEAMLQRELGSRLGVAVEDLASRGFVIESAGTDAIAGIGRTPEADSILTELQIPARTHTRRPLRHAMIVQADRIYPMERRHLDAILAWVPEAATKTRLLAGPADVPDPIGGTLDAYRSSARIILEAARRIAGEIVPPR